MNVKSLTLREVPGQNDMWLRPLSFNYTKQEVDNLDRVTNGGLLIDKNTISGVANNILRPSTMATAIANIQHGWYESRFLFIMEVDVRRNSNTLSTELVTGYTNYLGANIATRSIDPDMQFFVNNHVVISQTLCSTSMGNTWLPMITANNQVITPNVTANDNNGNNGEQLSTQRPEDLFSTVLMDSVVNNIMESHGGKLAPNSAPIFGGTSVKMSRRANLDSGNYLSRVLETQRYNRSESDYLGDNEMDVISQCARSTSEHSVQDNQVFTKLMRETMFMNSGSFTYGELLALDDYGSLDDRTNVLYIDRRNTGVVQQNYDATNTCGWGGADSTTLLGFKVGSQMVEILTECLVRACSFSVTNLTPDGSVMCVVENVNMMFQSNVGIDARIYYDRLVERIRMLAIAESSAMPGATFTIQGYATVNSVVQLDISIDGEPSVPYSYPVFGDSLFTPMVTNDINNVSMLSNDVRGLSRMLDEKLNSQISYGSPQQINSFNNVDNSTRAIYNNQPGMGHMSSPQQQSNSVPEWSLNLNNTY